MNRRFFWISLNYATFGIESEDDIITKAAPVAGWTVGKSLKEIKPFLLKRKAVVIEIFITD